MDVLVQSSLIVAITSFGIGLATLAKNVRNKLFLLFANLTTLITAWSLFFFLAKYRDSHIFYEIHLITHIWLAPVALAFIRGMVKLEDRWSRALLVISFVGAAVLGGMLVLGYGKHEFILQVIFFFPGLIFLQILQLIGLDYFQKSSDSHVLPRRAIIYIGGLLVLATSSLDHISWLGHVIPSFGNLALTTYIFFLSQAVTRQRLLNFGALLSRFLVILTVALTLTGIYSLLFTWIENRPALFLLNSFIISFLLLMLLEPIRTMVSYLTSRLLSKKYRNLEELLRRAQLQLVGVSDPNSLFQCVLQTVEETLNPEWCALYVLRMDGTHFRRTRMVGAVRKISGNEMDTYREISATHPMLEYCALLENKGDLPVLLDQFIQNEIDRSASSQQRAQLSSLFAELNALGANLLIPLFHRKRMLAFVALQVASPPEPWVDNWGILPMIYPYFRHAAEAMSSLEIFARQREKERLAALGEMAAGLAHEIRNPLGAIKGAAQYLDPGSPEGDQQRPENRFLRIIIEETDRLNRVVTQFLDYSKPASTDLREVEITALVEKTVERMRPALSADIELSFQKFYSKEGRLPHIMAEPEQLQQVLINLIQNSVRAVGSVNPKKILVKVEADPKSLRPEVVISVEDNGAGIKKENLDKLFIPFFTTTPSGTGLGLSISQKIVEAHRGRVEVATEEGKFARFSVILPVFPFTSNPETQ